MDYTLYMSAQAREVAPNILSLPLMMEGTFLRRGRNQGREGGRIKISTNLNQQLNCQQRSPLRLARSITQINGSIKAANSRCYIKRTTSQCLELGCINYSQPRVSYAHASMFKLQLEVLFLRRCLCWYCPPPCRILLKI